MSNDSWVFALKVEELKAGVLKPVYPKGLNILLTKLDDQIYAVANKCAHMACTLSSGTLSGSIVTCSCHDWRFDLKDGSFVDAGEIGLKSFKTKKEDAGIFILLEEGY